MTTARRDISEQSPFSRWLQNNRELDSGQYFGYARTHAPARGATEAGKEGHWVTRGKRMAASDADAVLGGMVQGAPQ